MNVTIIDDEMLENTESFNFTLERTTGLSDRITLDPVDGVVEIIDDDGMFVPSITISLSFPVTDAVVGLEETYYNVSEGVGVVEVCAIVYEPVGACPIAFPFTVLLSTIDDTAGVYILSTILTALVQLCMLYPQCLLWIMMNWLMLF